MLSTWETCGTGIIWGPPAGADPSLKGVERDELGSAGEAAADGDGAGEGGMSMAKSLWEAFRRT